MDIKIFLFTLEGKGLFRLNTNISPRHILGARVEKNQPNCLEKAAKDADGQLKKGLQVDNLQTTYTNFYGKLQAPTKKKKA